MEISMKVPLKTKNTTTIYSFYTTPEYLPKVMSSQHAVEIPSYSVYCSTIHNSWVMELAFVCINWWTDKENAVYIHNRVLLSHKEQNYVFSKIMDGTGDHHVKQNKLGWESQLSKVFSNMWNLDFFRCMNIEGGLFGSKPVGRGVRWWVR
jgi:hypothetical protein